MCAALTDRPVAPCPCSWPQVKLEWKPEASLTVVMAAKGYPGNYKKGTPIRGLERATTAKVEVFWLPLFLPPQLPRSNLLFASCPQTLASTSVAPSPQLSPKTARPPPKQVFHAGTATNAAGELVASGGRVLGVTALGRDVAEAQARAYEAVRAIDWEDGFYRTDIGWRAVARLKAGASK